MDSFTTEYRKILEQLPSMLKPTEPIPQHLQNYIKPYGSQTKRKHKRQNRMNECNNDNFGTIEELKKINEKLSYSQHKNISTQTDKIIERKVNSISVQTELITAETNNETDNEIICKLMNENYNLKEDNNLLENEIKKLKKELIEYTFEINKYIQEIEDKNIYNLNLIKHLDEKSHNETLLKKEINKLSKQLEKIHNFNNNNGENNTEIKELREHLIISEQKCLDWKKKWKIQCYKIEKLESEKIVNQHRIDKQLYEYQKIIQDFRNIMKNNLNSVNITFQNLNKENILLKNENEKLLFELGKIQENTFLSRKKTEKLLHKSVQCNQQNNENENENQNKTENNELYNQFNTISINIYKLIIDLKTKSCHIMNEYGLKSITNSPNNNKNIKQYQDTDDIDTTSIIVNCKKRFDDVKQIIMQLLTSFDDIMYEQAESQCDRCITQ